MRAMFAGPMRWKARIVVGVLAAVVGATFGLLAAPPPAAWAEAPEPPAGQLTADGASPIVGTVGSYCVTTPSEFFCSDAPPWIVPATGLSAGAAARLEFRLADASLINRWAAEYANASDASPAGEPLGGGEDAGPAISFSGPPVGDWVVAVGVETDWGDARYFYRLHVGLPGTDTDAADQQPAAKGGQALIVLILAAGAGMAGWRMRRRERTS